MPTERTHTERLDVPSGLREAYFRAGIATPHKFQETSWRHIVDGKNTLILAGTGSGKTEAALLPALTTGRRIVVLYPTKALLQDQHMRVNQLAAGKSIAVDTGDEDDRYFYRADVILTSLDKFLYRFFGYGKKRWSYLYPYRIGFAAERKTILILDEAHAYEDVAFSHFWFLLKKLAYERRVQSLLLSATLAPALSEALEDPELTHFPRQKGEGSFFDVVEDQETKSGILIYRGTLQASDFVSKALDFFAQGRRVIIVLERVVRPREAEKAVGRALHEVWELLSQKISIRSVNESVKAELASLDGDEVRGNVLSYHGHQMPNYRRRVLDRLKVLDDGWKPDRDGKPRIGEAFILVTTSAMEVGVDISSDVMITELCEPDSFIQRIGRCARRRGEAGEVYLIACADGKTPVRQRLLRDFMENRRIGSPVDLPVRQMLNALNTPPDLARIHLRLEYLQDLSLYRYVYDFVEENRELWGKGVVITRDWEPSVLLVRSEKRGREDYIGGIPARDFWCCKAIKEKILLPLSGAADLSPYCAWVFEGYNEGNQYTQRVAVGGSKNRTLAEALGLAGLTPRKQDNDGNRVQPLYAFGIPLVLILGSPQAKTEKHENNTWPYRDPNLGLSYHARYVPSGQEPKVFSPSPKLAARKVVLRKGKKDGKRESWQYELPFYWFEPHDEEPDEDGYRR